MEQYLEETALLDFHHRRIERMFESRGWNSRDAKTRFLQIYEFVRDEILFGYNRNEVIPASRVLDEGIGQCNTKGILLMALLRRAGFPCRFHAFTVTKQVQAGIMPDGLHRRLSDAIQHSWVEVYFRDRWINIEGFIVDTAFFNSVRTWFSGWKGSFCGFAIGVDELAHPPNEWTGGNTYIQHKAITSDLGVYDSPDQFYAEHSSNISGLKGIFWRLFYYKTTNRNVEKIRKGDFPSNTRQYVRECPGGIFQQPS